MLLDDFLPEFDVRTHHAIRVAAPPEHVYACVWRTKFDHWGITRALYALRTLPTFFSSPKETRRRFLKEARRQHFTLQELIDNGFALLGEQSGNELVLGTIGRFWRARGQLCAGKPTALRRTSSCRHGQGAMELFCWSSSEGRHRTAD